MRCACNCGPQVTAWTPRAVQLCSSRSGALALPATCRSNSAIAGRTRHLAQRWKSCCIWGPLRSYRSFAVYADPVRKWFAESLEPGVREAMQAFASKQNVVFKKALDESMAFFKVLAESRCPAKDMGYPNLLDP